MTVAVRTRKKKEEIVIPFLDKHNWDVAGGYCCPNENVLDWRDMIKDLDIDRAAGICSGGEVGFFALLPVVKSELVLIDHSYNSLSYAMFKYGLLRKRRAATIKKVFDGRGDVRTRMAGQMKDLGDFLPEQVAKKFTTTPVYVGGLARYWSQQTAETINAVKRNLDKVSFVHGDLTDLEGTFDLIYLSNALEHRSRTGKAPITKDVVKVVRPGGYVLSCSYGAPKDWKILSSKRTSWVQNLYQLPE